MAEVGWAGVKNGELLRRAATQFDLLLVGWAKVRSSRRAHLAQASPVGKGAKVR